MKRKFELSAVNVIILINVVVYIMATVVFEPGLIYYLFGINSPVTSSFLTYITAAFLHGSIMHLLFNMYFLFIIGPMLEKYLGSAKFILYYAFCMIGSGFITEMFSYSLSVGASGVLFAILTTCITLDKSDLPDFNIYNGRALINVLVINIIITFMVPNISIAGHISGVIMGLIAALAIVNIKERR